MFITLLFLACNSNIENNALGPQHKSYFLTRSVKKGEVFTKEMYVNGFPVLFTVNAETKSKDKDDEKTEKIIVDDEINQFIGRRFKRSYNLDDYVAPIIHVEMFEKTKN